MITKIYDLTGIHCAVCAADLESDIKKLQGVKDAILNFAALKLTVNFDDDTDVEIIEQSIKSAVAASEDGARVYAHGEQKQAAPSFPLRYVFHILGALIFFVAVGLEIASVEIHEILNIILFVAAYILVAYNIIIRFVRNIFRLKFFDENFLMTVATVAAFVLGEYLEGVAIMLFYQIGLFFQERAVAKSRRMINELMEKTGFLSDTQSRKAKSEEFITKFSKIYTPCMVGVAILIAIFGLTHEALVFLIVSCPCALVLSIPMCYYGGVAACSKRGILVKGADALEALCVKKSSVYSGNDPEKLKEATVGITLDTNPNAVMSADIVLSKDAGEDITRLIAKRTRFLALFNVVLVLIFKVVIIILTPFFEEVSVLLAEVADVGIALIAILVARTILGYRPEKKLSQ